MQYPDLHTPNLTLVFFNPSDQSHYEKIFHTYSHSPISLSSHADIDERAKRFSIPASLCHKSPPPVYPWLLCHVTSTVEYIGHIAVHNKGEWPAIGWAIHLEARGKGYATEAAKALLKFCGDVLGMESVGATMGIDHVASRRVAEKAGGKVIKGQERVVTEWGDMVQYEWVFREKNGE